MIPILSKVTIMFVINQYLQQSYQQLTMSAKQDLQQIFALLS